MKWHVWGFDLNHPPDPYIADTILSSSEITTFEKCDVVAVPIWTYHTRIKFNLPESVQITDSKKPVVVFDMTEYGKDWPELRGHFYGNNNSPHYNQFFSIYPEDHEEFSKLDQWLAGVRHVYFKRELSNQLAALQGIFPIDYIAKDYIGQPFAETEEQFNQRPIDLMHWYGPSHSDRSELHACMLLGAGYRDAEVVTNLSHIQPALFYKADIEYKRLWVAIRSPWYGRSTRNEMMGWFRKSKVVVAIRGSGYKCHRIMEVCAGSIVAQVRPQDYAWAYPWTEENSIILNHFEDALKDHPKDLYQRYLGSVEQWKRYTVQEYMRNHIEPKVKAYFNL